MNASNYIFLTLHLKSGEYTDAEVFSIDLQSDLKKLEILQIESKKQSDVPIGAKTGLTTIDWTTIFVTLAASGGLLSTIIKLIQSRLTQERVVILEIRGDKLEVRGISSEEQTKLIDSWIQRHQHPKRS